MKIDPRVTIICIVFLIMAVFVAAWFVVELLKEEDKKITNLKLRKWNRKLMK